jgi:hypothetical protein
MEGEFSPPKYLPTEGNETEELHHKVKELEEERSALIEQFKVLEQRLAVDKANEPNNDFYKSEITNFLLNLFTNRLIIEPARIDIDNPQSVKEAFDYVTSQIVKKNEETDNLREALSDVKEAHQTVVQSLASSTSDLFDSMNLTDQQWKQKLAVMKADQEKEARRFKEVVQQQKNITMTLVALLIKIEATINPVSFTQKTHSERVVRLEVGDTREYEELIRKCIENLKEKGKTETTTTPTVSPREHPLAASVNLEVPSEHESSVPEEEKGDSDNKALATVKRLNLKLEPINISSIRSAGHIHLTPKDEILFLKDQNEKLVHENNLLRNAREQWANEIQLILADNDQLRNKAEQALLEDIKDKEHIEVLEKKLDDNMVFHEKRSLKNVFLKFLESTQESSKDKASDMLQALLAMLDCTPEEKAHLSQVMHSRKGLSQLLHKWF